MLRSFQFFQNGGYVVVIAALWKPEWTRLHLKPARWLQLARLQQAETEQVVDDDLEGFAAAAHFPLQQHSNFVVDGKCGSHTLTLRMLTS